MLQFYDMKLNFYVNVFTNVSLLNIIIRWVANSSLGFTINKNYIIITNYIRN